MGNRWTVGEMEELENNYSEFPLRISPNLVLIHGKAGCYTKATKMNLNHRLRRGELDLSHWSEVQKAYMAGIIDGEGTITIVKNNRKFKNGRQYQYSRAVITIANTSYLLLDYLKSLDIGGFSYDKRINAKHHKQAFQWCLASVSPVYSLLKTILPYLVIKKSRAEEVIAWIKETKL